MACSDNHNNLLLVEDSNGYSDKDQSVTASDNVLRGMWIVSQVQGLKPYGRIDAMLNLKTYIPKIVYMP